MVQEPKVQLSRFPKTQQSNHPKSNHLDFQSCNVRFMESDRISTSRQLRQKLQRIWKGSKFRLEKRQLQYYYVGTVNGPTSITRHGVLKM